MASKASHRDPEGRPIIHLKSALRRLKAAEDAYMSNPRTHPDHLSDTAADVKRWLQLVREEIAKQGRRRRRADDDFLYLEMD